MKQAMTLLLVFAVCGIANAQGKIHSVHMVTGQSLEYERTDFDVRLSAPFTNPYISSQVALDMRLVAPSGRHVDLPCFFDSGDSSSSLWMARFAPREVGQYDYYFKLTVGDSASSYSDTSTFDVLPSGKNGFLHTDGLWVLRYDSGKPFRGIGENIAWESRSFENPKWNYNYLLPKLARDGGNFFRAWMCAWNLPLEWETVHSTDRYKNTDSYYNPGGIKRLDWLVHEADSLGLHIMLTLDNGSSLYNKFWYRGICDTSKPIDPNDFFTYTSIQQRYKDKLRYIIARWGYSTSIAAISFFNEIDNSAYTHSPQDSVIISQVAITEWHSEMSRYLHDIDPYHHIITTSISHRDILGLDMLPYIDINQKHIYKHTGDIRSEILRYSHDYNKPYVIGEFGYEWDWTKDFSKITTGLDYDFKRGLWYGLFSPTPILPMSWWWEFFDKQHMMPYFRAVRTINDEMLQAGNGSFKIINVRSHGVESYGVRCGSEIFVYLLNNSLIDRTTDVKISAADSRYDVRMFVPAGLSFSNLGVSKAVNGMVTVGKLSIPAKHSRILILKPAD